MPKNYFLTCISQQEEQPSSPIWTFSSIMQVSRSPPSETEAAEYDRVLAVNLRGPFLCAREAIRHFLSRTGGGV